MPIAPVASSDPRGMGGGAEPTAVVTSWLAAGILFVALAAGARLVLELLFGGLLPFLFTFPAVIGATLLKGERSGWVALIGCQALTYAFVLPHWFHDDGYWQQLVTFLLSTVSAGAAIWATASYQRTSDRLRHQCEQQVSILSLLIAEMDHRTKNNFQIAASLLSAQALASEDQGVRSELGEAANRLVSIASVYQCLAADAADGDFVSLRSHLERLCTALQAGLLPAGPAITYGGDDVLVSSSVALPVGLVVNEWVTNAVKHAFDGRHGTIRVSLACDAAEIRVEVSDDGVGMSDGVAGGIGSRLIPSLVETVGGRIGHRCQSGTTRIMTIPRMTIGVGVS